MRQYEMAELVFAGPEPEGSHVMIDLTAEIKNKNNSVMIKGFYAGNGTYKVRFLPQEAGEYSYKVKGLIEAEGTVLVEKTADAHGIVQAGGTMFHYEDGTRFIPFGTTIYAFFHQAEDLIDETMESLKNAPFNKVRLCVFPKHYDYNHNEPTYHAFEKDAQGNWDVDHPCMVFWDAFEKRLLQLNDMDIQVDLILFHPYDKWGYAKLPQKDNLIYLDYLLRRFAAMPNLWWSLANEYDLCAAKSMEDWYGIESFVSDNDPYHHLLSNHNCFEPWDFAREKITHVSIQTRALERIDSWMEQYHKPVVVDECCYEGNLQHSWGCISAREMVNRFWKAYSLGGYCTHGETFYDPDSEILWWAKGGTLKGESPKRIAFLREIMESLPGPLTAIPGVIDKFSNMSEEEGQEMMQYTPEEFQGFVKALLRTSKAHLQLMLDREKEYAGQFGDRVILKYLSNNCKIFDVLELSKDKTYTIEVIDTWEMTRTTVMTGVCGSVHVELPGREGIAILAMAE